jgi:UTP:GlnB (protein PII) uridylyltransferase
MVVTLFEKALFSSPQRSDTPRLMIESGLASAFIPELAPIVHRRRFSIHPSRPVHTQTILTLSHLKTLLTEENIRLSEDNTRALLWACLLYHVPEHPLSIDRDNSGETIARQVLTRFFASENLIQKVGFLLGHRELPGQLIHLKDLSVAHPDNSATCLTDRPEKQSLLYLLSLADLLASPSGYNPYKCHDLGSLFQKTTIPSNQDDRPETGHGIRTPSKFFHIESIPDCNSRYARIRTPFFPGVLHLVLGTFSNHKIEVYDARIHMDGQDECRIFIRVKSPLDAMFESKKWADVEQCLKTALSEKNITIEHTHQSISGIILNQFLNRDPQVEIHSDPATKKIIIRMSSNRPSSFFLELLQRIANMGDRKSVV